MPISDKVTQNVLEQVPTGTMKKAWEFGSDFNKETLKKITGEAVWGSVIKQLSGFVKQWGFPISSEEVQNIWNVKPSASISGDMRVNIEEQKPSAPLAPK